MIPEHTRRKFLRVRIRDIRKGWPIGHPLLRDHFLLVSDLYFFRKLLGIGHPATLPKIKIDRFPDDIPPRSPLLNRKDV